jgi:hypothetical protein
VLAERGIALDARTRVRVVPPGSAAVPAAGELLLPLPAADSGPVDADLARRRLADGGWLWLPAEPIAGPVAPDALPPAAPPAAEPRPAARRLEPWWLAAASLAAALAGLLVGFERPEGGLSGTALFTAVTPLGAALLLVAAVLAGAAWWLARRGGDA